MPCSPDFMAFYGAPGRIRTCDLRIRSPLICVFPVFHILSFFCKSLDNTNVFAYRVCKRLSKIGSLFLSVCTFFVPPKIERGTNNVYCLQVQ